MYAKIIAKSNKFSEEKKTKLCSEFLSYISEEWNLSEKTINQIKLNITKKDKICTHTNKKDIKCKRPVEHGTDKCSKHAESLNPPAEV
jgi:hypothetical protein